MKLQIENNIWCTGSHIHHNDTGHSHRLKKLIGWPRRTSDSSEHDYSATPHGYVCPYSPALLEVFDDAAKQCPNISMHKDVMEGQPCIDGTRIPVRSVLRAIEHYGSIEGAIKCYPHLSQDQVKDALYFSQMVLEPPSGIDETTVVD